MEGRVLVVDDEPEYLEMAKDMLSDSHEVIVSLSAEDGLRIARTKNPDVILLDLRIPQSDGVSLCREIRRDEFTKHIPVLMMTGACDPESRIRAFTAGADDYIHKPFTQDELIARVQSKIRRVREQRGFNKQVLQCGNLTLNLDMSEVRVGGEIASLTPIEFALLRLFLEAQGRILSRREILEKAWRGCVVAERTVDSHVASLRKKLKVFDHEIATKHGIGFFLSTEPRAARH